MGLTGRISCLFGNAGSVRSVTLTLVFALILSSVLTEHSTWASTSPARKNGIRVSTGQSSVVREQSFPAGWRISRFVAKEGPGGVYGARIFERQVKDGKSSFSIGNIVQFEFPKNRPSLPGGRVRYDMEQLSEHLRIGFGFERWRIARRQGNAHVFETDWQSQGRWVRAYAMDQGERFSISIALFRLAYAEDVAIESELIQRAIMGVLDKPAASAESENSKSGFKWERLLGISSAYAQAGGAGGGGNCTCPPNTPPNLCAPFQAGCLTQGLQQLLNQSSNTLGAIQNLANGINPAAINNALNRVGAVNVGALNNLFRSVPGLLQDANDNWAESNRLVSQFLDPGHAFVWAGASAAGAALGASAMGLLLDGVAAAGSAIYKAIQGKTDEELLDAFKKAREQYTQMNTASRSLEAALDNLLSLEELSRTFKLSREQILIGLGPLAAKTKAEAEVAGERLRTAIAGKAENACVDELALSKSNLDELHKTIGELQEKIAETKGIRVCDQIGTLIDKVHKAEAELQVARGAILEGQAAWERQWQKSDEELDRQIESEKETYLDAWRERVEFLKSRLTKRVAAQESEALAEIGKCEESKRGFAMDLPAGVFGGPDPGRSGAWRMCELSFGMSPKGNQISNEIGKHRGDYDHGVKIATETYWSQIKAAESRKASKRDAISDGGHDAYLKWFAEVSREDAGISMTTLKYLTDRGDRIDQICPGMMGKHRLQATTPSKPR